jgi:hypothetical protein
MPLKAIQNLKIKHKIFGIFRYKREADIFAILRSVFDTHKQNHLKQCKYP